MFDRLLAYKNGLKGAIATSVGLVQFQNFTLADNGAGPVKDIVAGKDFTAAVEISSVYDNRLRLRTLPENMAGVWPDVWHRLHTQPESMAGVWRGVRETHGI